MKIKLTALMLAAAICLSMTSCGLSKADGPQNGGESYSHKESRVLTNCEIGEQDGYGYELWKDNGNTTMTLMEDGNFSCEWSDINNALFRRGMKFDCTKTWQEIGSINLEYDVDYNPDGNSYLALYGWTRQPLVEYYIVEAWGNWRPPGGSPTATVKIDGDPYDIYETTRYNQPSIDGNTTFQQYWCVRQEPRTKGTLKVGTAFATWEALGMEMGKLYEASFTVEGYQSRGNATVHKNILVIDNDAELPAPAKGAEPETADDEGYYVRSDFENGTDGWEQRGGAKLSVTDSKVHSGSKCLSVTNRQDAWNGAARTLKPNTYTPGSAYSFGVYAMQDEKETDTFKLTLQYNANGNTNYAGIAMAEGKKGEWVKLENPSFTIPKGASGMILYVETNSGKSSFYIDDAAIAVDGVFEPLENCIPEDIDDIRVEYYCGGGEVEVAFTTDELPKVIADTRSWLAGLDCEYAAFEESEEPGNADGGEVYSFSTAEGSDLFSYCNYGGEEVYILARGNWYKVKNPSMIERLVNIPMGGGENQGDDGLVPQATIYADGVIPENLTALKVTFSDCENDALTVLEEQGIAALRSWFDSLDITLTAFDPNDIDGGEFYSFEEPSPKGAGEWQWLFSYCYYGGDNAYVHAGNSCYKASAPSNPPGCNRE